MSRRQLQTIQSARPSSVVSNKQPRPVAARTTDIVIHRKKKNVVDSVISNKHQLFIELLNDFELKLAQINSNEQLLQNNIDMITYSLKNCIHLTKPIEVINMLSIVTTYDGLRGCRIKFAEGDSLRKSTVLYKSKLENLKNIILERFTSNDRFKFNDFYDDETKYESCSEKTRMHKLLCIIRRLACTEGHKYNTSLLRCKFECCNGDLEQILQLSNLKKEYTSMVFNSNHEQQEIITLCMEELKYTFSDIMPSADNLKEVMLDFIVAKIWSTISKADFKDDTVDLRYVVKDPKYDMFYEIYAADMMLSANI